MANISVRLLMNEGGAKETSIPKEKIANASILKVGDKYFTYLRMRDEVVFFTEVSEPSDVTSYFKGL